MDVKNNMTNAQVSPNFGKLKITKKAVETMVNREEWDAFKPLLPGLKRLGKKVDITIDRSGFWSEHIEHFYSCRVLPKTSPVKDVLHKVKNFLNFGIDEKAGFSSITIFNSSKSKKAQESVKKNVTTSDFEKLYQDAHKDAKETIAKDSQVKIALKEAHKDLK